ncbi:MAG: hypothetical protein JW910_02465, partial [Anaerolineae bacterium]|nr:hypothetical protein [Anaerolineae bacterium]
VHDEFGALVAWQIRLADRTADDDSSLGVQLFPRFDDHGHDSINHDANDDHGLFDDDGHVFDDHGHEHGDDD